MCRWLECVEHCITVEEGERLGKRKTTGLSSGMWMSTQLCVHEKKWSKHRGGRIIIGNQQTKRLPYVMECWDGLCDSHLKWKDNVWMGSPVRSSKEHPLNRGATSSGHACAQCGSKHPKIALMSKISPPGLTLVRKQNRIQHLIMWSHNFQPLIVKLSSILRVRIIQSVDRGSVTDRNRPWNDRGDESSWQVSEWIFHRFKVMRAEPE